MPYTSTGIQYTDLGTRDANEMAEYARQERERRRQAQQPAPQPTGTAGQPSPQPSGDFSEAQNAQNEAKRAEARSGAETAWNNFKGSYSRNQEAKNNQFAQHATDFKNRLYTLNRAFDEYSAGNIDGGAVFESLVAMGEQLGQMRGLGQIQTSGTLDGGQQVQTGWNPKTKQFDLVYLKDGQTRVQSFSMDQVKGALKNWGLVDDSSDGGKPNATSSGSPASPAKGGSSSKPAEKEYATGALDFAALQKKASEGTLTSNDLKMIMMYGIKGLSAEQTKEFYDNFGQGIEGYTAGKSETEDGRNFVDGTEILRFGNQSATRWQLDDIRSRGDNATDEEKELLAAYDNETNPPEDKPPKDPLTESITASEGFQSAFDAARDRQRQAHETARRNRQVYVNGKWVTQGDIDDGKVDAKPEGEWENGIKRDALNAKRAENEAKDAERRNARPIVSEEERVRGLDEMLDRYGREDDEEWDRNNADYFDKDGAQLDPSEVTKDAKGNLVDKNGDPVRKEYWNDDTGGYDVKLSGDKVRVDMSEVRDTDARREEEIFDAVMQMSPETRRRLATETDEKGRLTYRASKVRQAIGAYVDKENIRDFSNAEGTMDGGAKRSDGSDRTAASVNKTYRDSKGGLVMEETFDGGRMTEQGREARINALLDAEIDPETGIADTRGDAEKMSRTERSEHGKSVDRRRAQIASINAQLEEADRKLHNDALREEGWMTEEDIENKEREQYLAKPRADVSENVANAEEMQSAANAGQMTTSERQRREWANRDRSKDSPASEPPAPEPAASEPENKPEPYGDNAEKHPNNDDAWLEKARNNVDMAFMKKWHYGGDARDAFREAKPKLIKWVSEKTKNNRYFTMPRGYRTEDQRMILEAVLEDMNLPKGEGNDSWILNSKDREELVRRINAISL